jgi:hypothetical protein
MIHEKPSSAPVQYPSGTSEEKTSITPSNEETEL